MVSSSKNHGNEKAASSVCFRAPYSSALFFERKKSGIRAAECRFLAAFSKILSSAAFFQKVPLGVTLSLSLLDVQRLLSVY
jgi:hypothetical protein